MTIYGPTCSQGTPTTLIAATELLAHGELALIDPELAAAARRYLRATSPASAAGSPPPTIASPW